MKEASRKTKIVVGGFILGSVTLLSFLIFFMGNNLGWIKGMVTYYTTFKSVEGLNVGASLRLGGVEIGRVQGINISLEGDTPKILVEIGVFKPNDVLIRVDSRIEIRTQGVLGDKFLTLIPGSTDAPPATPKTILPSQEGQGLFTAVNQTGEIVATIDSITKNVDGLVKELQRSKAVPEVIVNASKASESLRALTDRLNSQNSVISVLTDKDSAQSLKSGLKSFQQSSAHLASIAKKIDEGSGSLGAMVNDISLYDDIKRLFGRANRNRSVRYLIQKALETPEGDEKEPPGK